MKLPPGYVPGHGPPLKPSGYGGFGERMLRSMGWEKGQGLGRNNDGIKEAIEVKKKEDTVGVRGGMWGRLAAAQAVAVAPSCSANAACWTAACPRRRDAVTSLSPISCAPGAQIGGNASWNWQEKYWETAYESVQLGTQVGLAAQRSAEQSGRRRRGGAGRSGDEGHGR